MSTKNKTEDKLIESMRKNKTVAEKEDKKDEKVESSVESKQQKPSVTKTTDKNSFMTSRRVWPD